MADYQALPPGLNAVGFNGLSVDPNDFQMRGIDVVVFKCVAYMLNITDPLDNDFSTRDIPSFLPPSCFSKFDKPTNYM